MKLEKYKRHVVIFFFFLVFINWGCKKETLNDAIPVVNMVSVQQFGIDSVIVTGTITTNSGVDILYEGFCYGTDPVPPVIENQVLFQTDSTTFSAHLHVNKDSTYYFRCLAANSFGYAVSAPIK